MSEFDFKTLPYTSTEGQLDISEDYIELGETLCVYLLATKIPRWKPLTFYFAIWSHEMGDGKFLQIDIRELLNDEDISMPLKAVEKLSYVGELLSLKFESESELLNRAIEVAKV